MHVTLYEHCLREARGDWLKQWDSAADLPLTPAVVSHGGKNRTR